MLPAEVQEKSLINLVKEKQDSEALLKIIDMHSGIYTQVLNRFSGLPPIERRELIEQKDVNIYQYVMKYDETRGCKLSSYIGDSVRYECLGILNKARPTEEIDCEKYEDEKVEKDSVRGEYEEVANYLVNCAEVFYDERFVEIFKLRHLSGPKKMSWRKIGKVFGMSYENARNIYCDNIEKIKQKIKQEKLY